MDYERGRKALRAGLAGEALAEFNMFESRLLDNLEHTRTFGDNDVRKADRAQIVDQLNRLAQAHLGTSFNELCESPKPTIPTSTFQGPDLHQLRRRVKDFVGRTDEIERLVDALAKAGDEGAAVVIRGMGGLGKSELAYAVADRVRDSYPDAQLLIELRGTTEHPMTAAEAMKTVVHALEPQLAAPEDERQLSLLYQRVLKSRRVLILADDASEGAQIKQMLPPAGSALIVTTRKRMLLLGFTDFELQKLDDESARELLLAICPRISTFAARLAARCGNHSLALRVSASQLAHDSFLRVDQYLKMLEDERTRIARFKDRNDPQLDVEASLELSYKALKAPTKQALCQLSIFAASYDQAALNAVIRLPGKIDENSILSDLLHHSLLEWDETTERFSLHDMVRAFAIPRRKDEHNLWLRYSRHYLKTAEQSANLYDQGGENILAALALFDRERSHLDAVWRWLLRGTPGLETDLLLLAYNNAMRRTADLRYHPRNEKIPQLEAVLQMTQRRNSKIAEGNMLTNLGSAHLKAGDAQKALSYFQAGRAIFVITQDRELDERTLAGLGASYLMLGEPQKAQGYLENALEITIQDGNRLLQGMNLGQLSSLYQELGDFPKAIQYRERSLAIYQELRQTSEEAGSLANLAFLYQELENTDKAMELCFRSLAIIDQLGNRNLNASTLVTLSLCHNSLNQPEQALVHLQQALETAQEEENRSIEAYTLSVQAIAYTKLQQLPQSLAAFKESLRIFNEIGDRTGETAACWRMGEALAELGQVEQAVELMQRRVDYRREIGHLLAEQDAAWVDELRGRVKRADGLNEEPRSEGGNEEPQDEAGSAGAQ